MGSRRCGEVGTLLRRNAVGTNIDSLGHLKHQKVRSELTTNYVIYSGYSRYTNSQHHFKMPLSLTVQKTDGKPGQVYYP